MGASCWSHFVPYHPDIDGVLHAVREQIFNEQAYYLSEEHQAQGIFPATMEELIELNGEAGTHSIIDMDGGVMDTPEFAAVAPLTSDQLQRLFDTDFPDHAVVQERLESGELYNFCRRWEGVFITIYDGEVAAELCFVGCSGD
jgi:hypothetical protein